MTTAICKCGRWTNSATSDYWEQVRNLPHVETVTPTRCYAAWDGNKWVKGCSFDQAKESEKQFVIEIIGRVEKEK